VLTLNQWAARWQIPPAALADLVQVLGAACPPDRPAATSGQSEASLQGALRLEAARRGARLFRNNSGACLDETGRMIRYGLGNDSKQVNAVMKSSDLIGVWPYQVQPADVGRTLGIFTALEVKAPGWKLTPGDKRAAAQFNFIKLVASLGGFARFVSSMEDF
jgi:hypothetical protein